MKKTVLVTGGMGYIGYRVVKQLLNMKNVNLVVLDLCIYESHTLDEFKKNKRLRIVKGDIRNIADLVESIKDVDIIIALAAIVGDPACALNEEETYSSNYHSTYLLVQICNYYKIKRLIFASTCSVYGKNSLVLNEGSSLNPLSLYAKTRVMSEEIIKKYAANSLEWVILRFGTVFGWSNRMRFDLSVNFLTAKAFFENTIDIIGQAQRRPYVHVKDVAKAVRLAVFAKKSLVSGEIFNVGGNQLNIQIKNLAELLKEKFPTLKINYTDILSQDKRSYFVSFDKIQSTLQFVPQYSMIEGMEEIIKNLNKKKINYLDDKYYNVKYLFKNFQK